MRGEKGIFEYHLTQAGKDLRPVVEAMGFWGQKWVTSESSLGNLDPSLLMWDMRRMLRPDGLDEGRTVVEIRFRAAPPGRTRSTLRRMCRSIRQLRRAPGPAYVPEQPHRQQRVTPYFRILSTSDDGLDAQFHLAQIGLDLGAALRVGKVRNGGGDADGAAREGAEIDAELLALLAVKRGLDHRRLLELGRRAALPHERGGNAGDVDRAFRPEHALHHREVDLAVGDDAHEADLVEGGRTPEEGSQRLEVQGEDFVAFHEGVVARSLAAM